MKVPKLSESNYLLLLSVPFVIFIFIFSYVPLAGWIYAFYDFTPGLPLFDSPYVGFKYITTLFSEWSTVSVVMKNTLILSFFGIALTPLPVAFAIMLNEVKNKYFRKIVQTLTTFPNFISWIIVFGLFFSLFSVDGMLNHLLDKLGIEHEPFNLLGNPDIAWFLQAGLGLWKILGYNAIIYLAAIMSIDPELYDAAKVDGAGRWRCIWHITIPSIATTYFVLLLLAISLVLSNGFEQFYVFSNPLVADKLQVLDMYVYNMAFMYNQYSYSVAIGIWKTVAGIILFLFSNYLSKRIRGESLF